MLMEETWRPGNFIISQMVKGTTRCEGVRVGVKMNRTYAVCRRQQWFFFFFCCFHQLIGFYGAHWAGGKEDGKWASGLHLKPLCWAIKIIMRWTTSSGEAFAAKQQRFSLLININEALITNSSYQFSKMANLNSSNSVLNDFSLPWGLFQFVLVASLCPLSVSVWNLGVLVLWKSVFLLWIHTDTDLSDLGQLYLT